MKSFNLKQLLYFDNNNSDARAISSWINFLCDGNLEECVRNDEVNEEACGH